MGQKLLQALKQLDGQTPPRPAPLPRPETLAKSPPRRDPPRKTEPPPKPEPNPVAKSPNVMVVSGKEMPPFVFPKGAVPVVIPVDFPADAEELLPGEVPEASGVIDAASFATYPASSPPVSPGPSAAEVGARLERFLARTRTETSGLAPTPDDERALESAPQPATTTASSPDQFDQFWLKPALPEPPAPAEPKSEPPAEPPVSAASLLDGLRRRLHTMADTAPAEPTSAPAAEPMPLPPPPEPIAVRPSRVEKPVAEPPALPPASTPPLAPLVLEQRESPTVAPFTKRITPLVRRRDVSPLEAAIREALADSDVAAQYRRLADNVVGEQPRKDGLAILFVGVEREPHVAQTVAHLATTLTKGAHDVLLIDADVGEAELSRQLTAADDGGLVDVLARGMNWEQQVIGLATERLSLLPAGQGSLTSLAPSAAFQRLLDDLRSRFRLVLVNGGEVESSLARTFGRLCDGAYVVVRLGQTPVAGAHDAVTRLCSAGTRVLGCVVTNTKPGT